MRTKHIVIPLALLAASLAAHAEPLKVKPGLWETTTVTEKKGNKHPTNLDTLTPEQRAKVEKELAARAKKETHTVNSCLKEAKIKSGEAFMGSSHHGACKRTPETQTASDQLANIECKGANPMTGKVAMHALDPEHMTGQIEMTYGAKDKLQLLTRSDVTAKWLSSDCSKAATAKASKPTNPHPKAP
jgi:Spy/CpxP family protein refolding chaperone